MGIRNAGYDPEMIALLERASGLAWTRALQSVPTLGLLGTSGGQTREVLERGILEGAASGLRDPAALAEFALKAFPSIRLKFA